jgi:hypothetical protein
MILKAGTIISIYFNKHKVKLCINSGIVMHFSGRSSFNKFAFNGTKKGHYDFISTADS